MYQRTRNLFDPASKTPFKLSRSRLEVFVECPRCFYLDRRLGVNQPSMPAFTLNSAVDQLLKNEFDGYRRQGKPHPLMEQHGIRAVPFSHPDMDAWRDNFNGLQYHDKEKNLIIFGAIDDLWIDEKKTLYVVDYKSTSTQGKITLDTEYRQGYKRQMEMYQWLLRKQGFAVSDIGYFVYANARKDLPAFDGRLEFGIEILSYEGKDAWVAPMVVKAYDCLKSETVPDYTPDCEYCRYYQAVTEAQGKRARAGSQHEFQF